MITSWLADLEQEYKIDILLATETGSRAWGTATDQSDHDIRFVFKYKDIRSYLSLAKALETLNLPTPYDAQGWDVFKAFHLLHKSNPSLWEWACSPIVYKKDIPFSKKLCKYIEDSYSLYSLYQHYIHLMGRNMKEIQGKEINDKRQKQLIQAIRALLIAKAIHKFRKVPTHALYTNFQSIFSKQDELVSCYNKLIEAKQTGHVIEMDDLEEIQVLIVKEQKILDGKASQLSKGNNMKHELDEWIWELLHI